MKPIQFTRHYRDHQPLRDYTDEQVKRAIRGGRWEAARRNRLQCRMNFTYGRSRRGK